MTKSISRAFATLAVTTALSALALLSAGPGASAQTIPVDVKPTCVTQNPVTDPTHAFPKWFTAGSVSLNGVVDQANSLLFPDVPNCTFYQWSWQMFLWLNSPAPSSYGGGGRIFDSPVFFDVSPPDAAGHRTFIRHSPGLLRNFAVRAAQVGPHGLPIVFDTNGKLLDVERVARSPRGKALINDLSGKPIEIERLAAGPGGKVQMFDRTGKVITPQLNTAGKPVLRSVLGNPIVIDRSILTRSGVPVLLDLNGNVIETEQGQAGGNGVLLAQNSSLVYYITEVNDVYAYFLTGAKTGGILPAPTHFPINAADLAKITAYGALHGKPSFVDATALAIEMKSAWVELKPGMDKTKFITMTARIPTYIPSSTTLWTPGPPKTATLVMVGMHVVGSTGSTSGQIGHPEMIWATFEHFGNTPNAAYTYTNTGNANVNIPQSTAGSWMFTATGAVAPFNVQRMTYCDPNIFASNAGCPPSLPNNTVGPSNTLRTEPWGMPGSNFTSNTEVISIDRSVLTQLAPGDTRGNYFMTGATWTIFGANPNSGNQVGTNKLANTTMETYQQGVTNCFSCHQGNMLGGPGSSGLSHIYDPLQPLVLP